jgi:hypothetical protein
MAPKGICHLLEEAEGRFVQMTNSVTTFNPHLTMRGSWDEREFLDIGSYDPGWRKWRTCDPTSAHWYDAASLSRYIAAHIARDEDQGRAGRTVRDFISEFRGLTRGPKQKLVLAETDTARVSLASFFNEGKGDIGRLLTACKEQTRPVKPEDLGILGADHLLADCRAVGAAVTSFRYKKRLGITLGGLPYVVEGAFAYCPDADVRKIAAGVNFSVGIRNPFRLSAFEDLSSALARRYADADEPVVFIIHYTCPRVDYTDRGKSTLNLPSEVRADARAIIEAVTKDWHKQRLAEVRHAGAAAKRREQLLKEHTRPKKTEPPEPTGTLGQKILSAAGGAELSIDDLTVLSPGNDPYTAWRRRREAEWFAKLFNRFVAASATKHLRGFFYLLVSSTVTGSDGKPFVNDYKHWKALQDASKAARWLGLIEFERIVDERNAPPEIHVPGVTPISTAIDPGAVCEIPATAECALPAFRLAGFNGQQSHRIIFYGEKSSLAVVLRPIAEEIGAEMILVTGRKFGFAHFRDGQAGKRGRSACRRLLFLGFRSQRTPNAHQCRPQAAGAAGPALPRPQDQALSGRAHAGTDPRAEASQLST